MCADSDVTRDAYNWCAIVFFLKEGRKEERKEGRDMTSDRFVGVVDILDGVLERKYTFHSCASRIWPTQKKLNRLKRSR